ncbi:TPA: ABC transporter ATP-binding protein [Candidatus Bipolaricaulota bacterium]|nr:ABC transporter ATP-binding protein [Candidatus Bipolaricaulota bacterium]
MNDSNRLIELREVWKTYPMGKVEVHALRGVSLTLEEGEFLAVMGPSGSGKSTLIHLMGCLDLPTRGEVLFEGTATSRLKSRELAEIRGRKIGFVFQTFNLVHTLTALENVELPLVFQGAPRPQRRGRARELLEQVGLGDRLDHRPNELSGGEQQRVAIARALANDPIIVLCDEPTGNLDSAAGRMVLEALRGLNEDGRTVVLVSHNPEAAAYAERRVRLRDGRIQTGGQGQGS